MNVASLNAGPLPLPQHDLFAAITIAALFGLLGVGLLFVTRNHRAYLKPQVQLFLVAMAVRFGFALVIYEGGLVDILKDEDASGWVFGLVLRDRWVRQNFSIFDIPFAMLDAYKGHHHGRDYLFGALFWLTGTSERLCASAMNCFFGALTVVFAYRIARSLFSPWVASRVGWWTCFFPSMILWSAMTVKEPIVILLETVALYGCVQLQQSRMSTRHLVLCAATVVLLLPFRFYAAYLVGAVILFSLLMPGMSRLKSAAAALVLLAVMVPLLLRGTSSANESTIAKFDITRVQRFRDDVSTGKSGSGSGVRTDFDMTTPGGFALGTAVGAAHLLLAPFPWQYYGASARMLLTLPEAAWWWYLCIWGGVPGLIYAIRHRLRDVRSLLVIIAVFGLLYSMMFGNVGLVFRQRAQLLPWLLIFSAVGMERRMLKRRERSLAVLTPDQHLVPWTDPRERRVTAGAES